MNEAQTLTLEAGKYYRTRDGRKAFVVGENPFETAQRVCPFYGFIESHGLASWSVSGCYFSDGSSANSDLVAEWVEPKRIKGWMNVYQPNVSRAFGGDIYGSQAEAAANAGGMLVARIEIDVLEGHGLGEAA